MRNSIVKQLPLVHTGIDHEHADELRQISEILDSFGNQLLDLVYGDLIRKVRNPKQGRAGMSADQVLRALLLKQMRGFSYEQLRFHLLDSTTYRAFCRYGIGDETPSVATLKHNLKRIEAETLETINGKIVLQARDQGIEDGKRIRTDCTVEETNIHKPSDSHLLFDCVRVLARVMGGVKEELLPRLFFTDHTARAKRRFREIQHTGKEKERVKLYRDLVKITEKTATTAASAVEALEAIAGGDTLQGAKASGLARELHHYGLLAQRVIDQTKRRVFYGEAVAPEQKVVSIFEPHTDIIIKDRRDTHFGHKLCLTTGKSGLVVDCVIEDGNPADSTLAVRMVERVERIFGVAPEQAAFDGGFACRDNLVKIKALGVEDVAFNKKRGLEISEMASSSWVYRCLSFFRAGIESTISFLKRCFGLGRCMWRGLASYKSYTWASILSHNLLILARHRLR
jgi:transposase, IS5 family